MSPFFFCVHAGMYLLLHVFLISEILIGMLMKLEIFYENISIKIWICIFLVTGQTFFFHFFSIFHKFSVHAFSPLVDWIVSSFVQSFEFLNILDIYPLSGIHLGRFSFSLCVISSIDCFLCCREWV